MPLTLDEKQVSIVETKEHGRNKVSEGTIRRDKVNETKKKKNEQIVKRDKTRVKRGKYACRKTCAES